MSTLSPGWLLDPIMVMSTGTMLMGVVFKHRDRHMLRSGGYALFAVFWLLRIGEFRAVGDVVNLFFVIAAVPFFLYLSMLEYRIYRGDMEPNSGLEMLAGAVAVASLLYFSFAKIPYLSGGAISAVADQTVFLSNLTGGPYSTGGLDGPWEWYTPGFSPGGGITVPIYRPDGSEVVRIEFACTGVQSMMVFLGPIMFTGADRWR
ncbi:MAG: archaeosortase A, partial [Thermoplasmata archaeon]|nr:archaeosortase A [Thermoplasmata archaeon]